MKGATGVAGADAVDGVNAFTSLLSAFTVPAVGAEAVAEVGDTSWIVPSTNVGTATEIDGQILVLQFAGHFLATSVVDATHVTLYNLGYPYSAAAGTAIPVAAALGVGGMAGTAGTVAAGSLLVVNDLSDVNSAVNARANLGLGSLSLLNAVADANFSGVLAIAHGGTSAATAAAARTALGAAASGLATGSGLTSSATDKVIGRSAAGAGALEELACTAFGRSLIAAASAAAAKTILGGFNLHFTSVATDYLALLTDDVILVDATAGPVRIDLPPAATMQYKVLYIRRTDAGAANITIDPSGAEQIDNAASVLVTTHEQIYCDGTEWWTI